MTFSDWIEESIERYRTEPFRYATKESAKKFAYGASKRTVDHVLGETIWGHDEWDVLVIMDACRQDQLEAMRHEYPALPFEIPGMWSAASCSKDWIQANFVEHPEKCEKTAYITANPFTNHNDRDSYSADLTGDDFAHLELLYNHFWDGIGNGIETVPPETVTDRSIDVWRRREELGVDRMVIHYMQPHEPFRSRPEWGNGDHKLLKNLVSEGATAGDSVYPLVQQGEIGLDEFWRVYCDNLRWVLDDVTERLLTNCDADVVLSADHGNGLGEWGYWHHPPGGLTPQVRRVPWVHVDSVDDRTVTDLRELEPDSVDEVTAEQLEALGYA